MKEILEAIITIKDKIEAEVKKPKKVTKDKGRDK